VNKIAAKLISFATFPSRLSHKADQDVGISGTIALLKEDFLKDQPDLSAEELKAQISEWMCDMEELRKDELRNMYTDSIEEEIDEIIRLEKERGRNLSEEEIYRVMER
jgi:hypothetical protein